MDFDAALQAYYARDLEGGRLASGIGRLEFLRTVEIITRTLPEAPSVVADIGGGPGRYTDWLVELGHRVVHRDVVARRALADIDARLDEPDERTLLLDTLRSIEAVPDLLGVGPHLLAVAQCP